MTNLLNLTHTTCPALKSSHRLCRVGRRSGAAGIRPMQLSWGKRSRR